MTEDSKSWGEKSKHRFREIKKKPEEAAKTISKGVGEATDALTGKKVENLVSEYSDTYTKVALGLHQDLEAQGEAIKNIQVNRDKDNNILNGFTDRVDELENKAQELREDSDAYTKVALGLRQDLEAQGEAIKNIQVNRDKDNNILNGFAGRVDELENIAHELKGLRVAVKKIETVKYIALSALIVSAFTIAGVLWIAI